MIPQPYPIYLKPSSVRFMRVKDILKSHPSQIKCETMDITSFNSSHKLTTEEWNALDTFYDIYGLKNMLFENINFSLLEGHSLKFRFHYVSFNKCSGMESILPKIVTSCCDSTLIGLAIEKCTFNIPGIDTKLHYLMREGRQDFLRLIRSNPSLINLNIDNLRIDQEKGVSKSDCIDIVCEFNYYIRRNRILPFWIEESFEAFQESISIFLPKDVMNLLKISLQNTYLDDEWKNIIDNDDFDKSYTPADTYYNLLMDKIYTPLTIVDKSEYSGTAASEYLKMSAANRIQINTFKLNLKPNTSNFISIENLFADFFKQLSCTRTKHLIITDGDFTQVPKYISNAKYGNHEITGIYDKSFGFFDSADSIKYLTTITFMDCSFVGSFIKYFIAALNAYLDPRIKYARTTLHYNTSPSRTHIIMTIDHCARTISIDYD